MITIMRKLPVINGFVQVPDGEFERQADVTVDEVLSGITGTSRILRLIRQDFVEFPSFGALTNTGYPVDWFEEVRSL